MCCIVYYKLTYLLFKFWRFIFFFLIKMQNRISGRRSKCQLNIVWLLTNWFIIWNERGSPFFKDILLQTLDCTSITTTSHELNMSVTTRRPSKKKWSHWYCRQNWRRKKSTKLGNAGVKITFFDDSSEGKSFTIYK